MATWTAIGDNRDRFTASFDPSDDVMINFHFTQELITPWATQLLLVGFVREYSLDNLTCEHGVYMLRPVLGTLHGTGKDYVPYCSPLTTATLRCVADRTAGTISFHVNGVDCGVAWTGVEPGALRGGLMFWRPGINVQLL